jgi:hypothetical protein
LKEDEHQTTDTNMPKPTWWPEDNHQQRSYNVSGAASHTYFDRKTVRKAITEGKLPATAGLIIASDDLRAWYNEKTGRHSALRDLVARVVREHMEHMEHADKYQKEIIDATLQKNSLTEPT